MAIYLQAPGFQGNVTTKGFQNWLELSSVHFTGIQLDAQMQVGRGSRLTGQPHFGSFIITKPPDKSSMTFFDRIVAATVIPTMTIAYVTTSASLNTYQKYQLKNVMITQLGDAMLDQQGRPQERIALELDALLMEYRDFEHLALKESVIVANIAEVEKVSKVGYYLTYAGKAYNIIKATDYFFEVKAAYDRDGRWLKDAIEDSLKLLVAVAAPVVIGVAFVGGGWVVVLAAAGTEVVINTVFDFGIDKIGNWVDNKF